VHIFACMAESILFPCVGVQTCGCSPCHLRFYQTAICQLQKPASDYTTGMGPVLHVKV